MIEIHNEGFLTIQVEIKPRDWKRFGEEWIGELNITRVKPLLMTEEMLSIGKEGMKISKSHVGDTNVDFFDTFKAYMGRV